jgi:uncharacterized protein (TIGR03437 family)
VIGAPVPLASAVKVRFGATVVDGAAWLVSAGLYQINAKVPDSQVDGDVAVTVSAGGVVSTASAQLTVRRAR